MKSYKIAKKINLFYNKIKYCEIIWCGVKENNNIKINKFQK